MVFRRSLRQLRIALILSLEELLRSQHDLLLKSKWAAVTSLSKNPLNRFGAKFFSQSDEHGVTLEIIKRLGLERGVFLELGVGDSLENNTLVLLSIRWRGAWIGGRNLAFDPNLNPKQLPFTASDADVLGVDLDGNYLYFTEALLGLLHPKLVIVEYHARFPPPARWSIKYDPHFRWDGTDYQGASLSSFRDLLARFDHTLVGCSAATGVNGFFVKNTYTCAFNDVPRDIGDIFVNPRYELPVRIGHPTSRKTIEQMSLHGIVLQATLPDHC